MNYIEFLVKSAVELGQLTSTSGSEIDLHIQK